MKIISNIVSCTNVIDFYEIIIIYLNSFHEQAFNRVNSSTVASFGTISKSPSGIQE